MKQLIPAVLVVVCLALMVLLRWAWPLRVFLRPPFVWAGLLPLLAGGAVVLAGIYRFRKAHTTIRPFHEARHLVTGGVYLYTRNPMYLGDVLMLLGFWLLLGAISPVGPVVAFWLIADRWFIRAEETMLTNKFGQEYEEYCRRTRRWI
jgi:protein-S-isoprenylcysteine O-methyltransferase Ste14